MKEKMIEFLRKAHLPIYYEEREIIQEFIETFFNQYQPERLSEKTPIPEYGAKSSLNFDEWQRRCDSLNSMET